MGTRETYAAVLAIWPNRPLPPEAAAGGAWGAAWAAGAAWVAAGRVCCCDWGFVEVRAGTVGREGAERPPPMDR